MLQYLWQWLVAEPVTEIGIEADEAFKGTIAISGTGISLKGDLSNWSFHGTANFGLMLPDWLSMADGGCQYE